MKLAPAKQKGQTPDWPLVVKVLNTTGENPFGQYTLDIMHTGKNTTGQNATGQNFEKYLLKIKSSNMKKIQLDKMQQDKMPPG